MIKALLTSSSFSNKKIIDFFNKNIQKSDYKTVAIITTAHPQKENAKWNIQTKKDMESLRLKTKFIDFEVGQNINNEDVVYVCGGNTYKLLYFIQKLNFANKLKDLFNRNGFYIGTSAGSVIMSPTILSVVSDRSKHKDQNKIGITDFTAMGFIDFNIIVHCDKERYCDTLKNLKKFDSKETICLSDGNAVYVEGTSKTFIV